MQYSDNDVSLLAPGVGEREITQQPYMFHEHLIKQ